VVCVGVMASRLLQNGGVAVEVVYYAYEDEEGKESHGLIGGGGPDRAKV